MTETGMRGDRRLQVTVETVALSVCLLAEMHPIHWQTNLEACRAEWAGPGLGPPLEHFSRMNKGLTTFFFFFNLSNTRAQNDFPTPFKGRFFFFVLHSSSSSHLAQPLLTDDPWDVTLNCVN